MSLFFFQNPLIHKYYPLDSSIYEYTGKLITEGYIPYRDIFEHKGPLFYLWYALGYTIQPMTGQWILELLLLFLDLILMYKIASEHIPNKLFFTTSIAMLIAIPLLDTIGNTENISWTLNLGLICLFYNFLQTNKLSALNAFLIGALSTALLLIKLIYLPCAFCIVLYIIINFLQNKRYNELGHFLLYGGWSFALILGGILSWLGYHNALKDFWDNYFVFNMLYAKEFHLLKTYGITIIHFLKEPFIWVSIIVVTGVLTRLKTYSKIEKNFLLILIISLLIGLLLVIIPRNSHNHYLAGILPYVWVLSIFALKKLKFSQFYILFIALFILCRAPIVLHDHFNYMKNQAIKHHATLDVASFIEHRLDKNERFASFSQDFCTLYLYSKHNAYNKYAFVNTIAHLRPDIVIQSFTENPPEWIVVDLSYAPLVDFQKYTIVYQNSRMIVWHKKSI